jgi:putative DNA primase/helicase
MPDTDTPLTSDKTTNAEATPDITRPHDPPAAIINASDCNNSSAMPSPSNTLASLPQSDIGAAPHDQFLAMMERDLPIGFIWMPEFNLICKCDGEDAPTPFCAPIHIRRLLRTPQGEDWSWQIAFLDRDGVLREEIISIANTKKSPSTLTDRLSGRGFDLRARASDLSNFLMACHVEDRGWIVHQGGWFETPDGTDGPLMAYVEPDGQVHYSPNAANISITLTGPKGDNGKAGSLEGWQNNVAMLALENPALIFSVCVALAGPLLRFSGIDTMGFNYFAKTSSGKTHALKVAASCGNSAEAIHQWNGTPSGLALLTAAANDRVLMLDEFPSKPDKEVIEALYSIGNGTSKTRATQKTERWRVALLSTSEKSLPDMFNTSRNEMPEGLGMRLLDIPARSWTYGLIENLHGYSDGHTFLLALTHACNEDHGHVLPAFVEAFLQSDGKVARTLPQILAHYRAEMLADLGLSKSSTSGQIHRAVERFALVAAAGEIATEQKLLPWPRKTAASAAKELLLLWYNAFQARQTRPASDIIQTLRIYLAENIQRFIDVNQGQDAGNTQSPGWKDEIWIYMLRDDFEAHFFGDEPIRTIAQHLIDAKILAPGGEARSLQYRMPERLVRNRPRVYRLRRAKIEE